MFFENQDVWFLNLCLLYTGHYCDSCAVHIVRGHLHLYLDTSYCILLPALLFSALNVAAAMS